MKMVGRIKVFINENNSKVRKGTHFPDVLFPIHSGEIQADNLPVVF
jgi:hypothetical protein